MSDFVLTNDNYYSKEADERYMSFHQYQNFIGGNAIIGCEEKAMKMLSGEYSEPSSKALLIGGYFDALMEGSVASFKLEHPECFTQKGELRADYVKAEAMYERIKKDKDFMRFCDGEKQVMLTGYFAGCEWRGKLDVLIRGKCIVDIKTTADLHKSWWTPHGYTSFVEAYNYIGQLAVYQKLVELNYGEKLPCYIAAVEKGDITDYEVIGIDQDSLDFALSMIEENMPHVLAVKNGEINPTRCGQCAYCKSTKHFEKVVHYMDLVTRE